VARRTLSTQGRIIAAGVSVAVGGVLVGFMAAGDHTAHASQTTTSSATRGSTTAGTSATPYDANGGTTDNGYPQVQPQPQTRTGGS